MLGLYENSNNETTLLDEVLMRTGLEQRHDRFEEH